MFTPILGTVTTEAGVTLYGVEYINLRPRDSRYDWANTQAARNAIVESVRALDAGGQDYATYRLSDAWRFEADAPTVEPPTTTAETIAAEFPGVRDEAATAKLRELVRERNQLRRDRVETATAFAAEADSLRARLRVAQVTISDVADERLSPIWERAAEAATEAGFCSEYEKLCDILGIPGRERLYRGVVEVRFNVYAYATATNADDAEEEITNTVRERLTEIATEDPYSSHDDGSVSHLDVTDVGAEQVEVYE